MYLMGLVCGKQLHWRIKVYIIHEYADLGYRLEYLEYSFHNALHSVQETSGVRCEFICQRQRLVVRHGKNLSLPEITRSPRFLPLIL